MTRLITAEMREKTWDFLRQNPEMNEFEDREEFEGEFASLGEMDAEGVTFVYRRRTNQPFGPGNMVMTNVDSDDGYAAVTFPAVKGGHDDEN